MDILGLEAFIRIAESGSFRAAAATMGLSQTALSHRLKKLEEELGLVLLQRTTRSMVLTRTGQEFYPQARELMQQFSGLFEDFKARGGRGGDRLAIGCLASLGKRFLPPALHIFRERYPTVTVIINDVPAPALSERVLSGEIQFALTILGAQHWAQKSRTLFTEEFAAAVPQDHPLATKKELLWADLVGYPLARVSAETGHGTILAQSLSKFPYRLDWRYEFQYMPMAASLVTEGLAISISPRSSIPEEPGIKILPISEPVVTRTVGIISRSGIPLTPEALYLERLLVQEIESTKANER